MRLSRRRVYTVYDSISTLSLHWYACGVYMHSIVILILEGHKAGDLGSLGF